MKKSTFTGIAASSVEFSHQHAMDRTPRDSRAMRPGEINKYKKWRAMQQQSARGNRALRHRRRIDALHGAHLLRE
jgi:hypothetical protein